VASALHAISTPYSTSVSFPLYAITARGQLPRHIVRQFQSPYTPSLRGLSRISARQVALALASRFSRMLSFQIKDIEFTAMNKLSTMLFQVVTVEQCCNNMLTILFIVGRTTLFTPVDINLEQVVDFLNFYACSRSL
jgi:hypothetical protein